MKSQMKRPTLWDSFANVRHLTAASFASRRSHVSVAGTFKFFNFSRNVYNHGHSFQNVLPPAFMASVSPIQAASIAIATLVGREITAMSA